MQEQDKKPAPPAWELLDGSGPVCVDGVCFIEGESQPEGQAPVRKLELITDTTTQDKQS